MLFWLAAALLTMIAALAALWPWLRNVPMSSGRSEADLSVYRDQLAELDRDVARGALPAAEAEEARAEIGRRALKAAAEIDKPEKRSGAPRALHVAAILIVPIAGWAAYADLGSPGLPDQPLVARLQRDPAQNSVEELVARAEAHLKANPADAAGWDVVAPIYMRIGRYDDAVNAFTTVIRLAGSTAAREAGLGEALLARDGGTIGPQSLAAFERALALDPKMPKARFFLAVADAQAGRQDAARTRLKQIVDETDPGSPWAGASRNALAELDGGPSPGMDGGPSQEDMAAASGMSDQDRKAMIETMVAKLDARLSEDPSDAEGWKKLIRSYLVLGRSDDARSALERAGKGLDADRFSDLKAFARDAGLEGVN
jgi:cytochrome c-type biogenesis protein CcmH